jgi:predicted Zn finger-like uncharacterized protein
MNDPTVHPGAPAGAPEPATAAPERMVRCPGCDSRYRLPESMLGDHGVRVRCRGCGVRFEVDREPDAAAIAARVVEDLADRIPAIRIAQARGRLFAEAGTFVFEAYDAWRRRAGPGADVAVFRDALSRRWEVAIAGAPPRSERRSGASIESGP